MQLRLIILATAMTLALMAIGGAPAFAAFSITGAGGSSTHADGTRDAQAGSHPDYTTKIDFPVNPNNGRPVADGNLKDIEVALPPGLVGNPTVVPTCKLEDLKSTGFYSIPGCPMEAQVGSARVGIALNGSIFESGDNAIYNIEPSPGTPAAFAFNVLGVIVMLTPEVRGNDYGLTVHTTDVSQSLALTSTTIKLWGVPADPANDDERYDSQYNAPPHASGLPAKAFMSAPTECAGPQTITVRGRSWQVPEVWSTASFNTDFNGQPLQAEGCGNLPFAPTVGTALDSRTADSPSGLAVDLDVPQDGLVDPTGLATAHVKDVKVSLPEGLTINPSSANGLAACTDAQLGLGDTEPTTCPDAAKIGTVKATTPLLTEVLEGSVYLRTQASDDPESGDMFRLALVLRNDERGLLLKLPGSVRADKATGRLETAFLNNPRLPVSKLELQLKSGSRAPLATPDTCGAKPVQFDITSWGGQSVTKPDSLAIACAPGLGGFSPSLTAGVADPVAGATSAFTLGVHKDDGQSQLNGVSLTMPGGLLANLKGNLGQRVGTAKVAAGPGASPFWLSGPVVLEGPYGDAPFSLRVSVPAIAGPFNLGTVVVRQKIYVDPIDAHVTVVSDPLPTIVAGVPVRLQGLQVDVDKPGFMLNPTSCATKAISGTLSAVGGQTAAVTKRFQVGDCASLALKPDLALTLSGKGETTDGKHPAISASLTQKLGQANLKKVRVTLPLSLALDPDNANGLCEFVDGSKATPTCPKDSIVGTATATTPILDEPLSGPVYFVKNVRKDPKSGREIRTLPKLVIPLVGQNGVKLTLTGTSDVEDEQLVTTLENIPDAPVSSFKLNIIGGKGGILAVSSADICKATQVADQQIDGQNNKQADADVYIQTPSCPLKVLSKKVGKSSVAIKVGGLGAGKVTVTGRGIKKTSKTISKSTVATIVARRSKGMPGKVTVSFDPTGPAKARKTSR